MVASRSAATGLLLEQGNQESALASLSVPGTRQENDHMVKGLAASEPLSHSKKSSHDHGHRPTATRLDSTDSS